MGYWEQIGAENLRNRERRNRMRPAERRVRDALNLTMVGAITLVLWGIMLAPILIPIFR